jgi:Uma2 family endonuclease
VFEHEQAQKGASRFSVVFLFHFSPKNGEKSLFSLKTIPYYQLFRTAMTPLAETSGEYLAAPDMMRRLERLTIAEFRAMEFDDDDTFYYELLEGELVQKSAPNPFHQRVSGNIFFALRSYVSQNNLGEVFYAPVDVFLDEYNLLQPDVLFLSNDRKNLVTIDGILGAPNLVVEIVSPSTVKRDRGGKMSVYERFGVLEYWIVDIRTRSVEVYVNTNKSGNDNEGGRFDFFLHEVYVADERNPESPVVVRSVVLSTVELPLESVFAGV